MCAHNRPRLYTRDMPIHFGANNKLTNRIQRPCVINPRPPAQLFYSKL